MQPRPAAPHTIGGAQAVDEGERPGLTVAERHGYGRSAAPGRPAVLPPLPGQPIRPAPKPLSPVPPQRPPMPHAPTPWGGVARAAEGNGHGNGNGNGHSDANGNNGGNGGGLGHNPSRSFDPDLDDYAQTTHITHHASGDCEPCRNVW
jgi:hypothetical protein